MINRHVCVAGWVFVELKKGKLKLLDGDGQLVGVAKRLKDGFWAFTPAEKRSYTTRDLWLASRCVADIDSCGLEWDSL